MLIVGGDCISNLLTVVIMVSGWVCPACSFPIGFIIMICMKAVKGSDVEASVLCGYGSRTLGDTQEPSSIILEGVVLGLSVILICPYHR